MRAGSHTGSGTDTEVNVNNTEQKVASLTRIQRLIGKRMLASKAEKPCFYISTRADVTELMGQRHKLKKSLGVKIKINAFYIRALSLAAKNYPLMVGRLQGRSIKIARHINVGFAVSASHGLVVPVLKAAEKKTLAEIAVLEKELADKARSNKLTLEEMEQETIAMSNLGAYDIDSFIGIVPLPASTIMAVGNVIHTAVPCNGKPVERKMVNLTLAVDRRVVNEVYAAKFLSFIKEQLQNPQQLV